MPQPERLVQFKVGRAWFGKLPEEEKFEPDAFLEKSLPRGKSSIQESRSVCLRITLIYTSAHYGLLGATYIPDTSDQLTVRVGISNVDEESGALTSGLPRELAEVVFETVLNNLEHTLYIGSGNLTFNYAAWHLVDSSPYVFRILTRCLLLLLDPKNDEITEEQLNQLVLKNRHEFNNMG